MSASLSFLNLHGHFDSIYIVTCNSDGSGACGSGRGAKLDTLSVAGVLSVMNFMRLHHRQTGAADGAAPLFTFLS